MPRTRIYCITCRSGQICGSFELADLLRAQGMLRRESEPDETVLEQLLQAALPTIPCPECGAGGLAIDESFQDDGDAWDEWEAGGRQCAQCGAAIPEERLSLYPDAERCAACESSGGSKEDVEYCPRCGSIMTIRTSSQGVTRYRLFCPECKR